VLTHSDAAQASPSDVTLRMPKSALPSLAAGPPTPETLEGFGVQVEGDLGAVARLLAAMDAPDPDFAIVTP
jgi:alkyl sulfatase BDS1-like metallo-beta-lactamase superfamily hydrolase